MLDQATDRIAIAIYSVVDIIPFDREKTYPEIEPKREVENNKI